MSTVEDLINQVTSQDFSKAGPTFNELLNAKLGDALEAEKIRISDQVYNAAPEEDEETEEELEDEIEEEESEDETEEDNT